MATARAHGFGSLITRRRLLATGTLLAAGGAGIGLGLARPISVPGRAFRAPPAALTSALHRERAMVVALDLAMRHDPSLRARIAQIRHDHAAHAAALESAISAYRPAASGPARSPTPPANPPSAGQLRAAELAAAGRAGAESAALLGANAALLASISAAETTHAELLA